MPESSGVEKMGRLRGLSGRVRQSRAALIALLGGGALLLMLLLLAGGRR